MKLKTPLELLQSGLIPKDIAKAIIVHKKVSYGVVIKLVRVAPENIGSLLEFIEAQHTALTDKGELKHPGLWWLKPITEASGLSYEDALAQQGDPREVVKWKSDDGRYCIVPPRAIIDALNHPLILTVVIPVVSGASLQNYASLLLNMSNVVTPVLPLSPLAYADLSERPYDVPIALSKLAWPGSRYIDKVTVITVVHTVDPEVLNDRSKWDKLNLQVNPTLHNTTPNIVPNRSRTPYGGRSTDETTRIYTIHGGLVDVFTLGSISCIIRDRSYPSASRDTISSVRNALTKLDDFGETAVAELLEGKVPEPLIKPVSGNLTSSQI